MADLTWLRRSSAAFLACAALGVAGCGGGNESPFGNPDPNAAAPTAPDLPPTTADTPSATPVQPIDPLPTTPAEVPSPTGTTPTPLPVGKAPEDLTRDQRIEADQTAMLNVRTMVSIIEGCHSGRESYRDCNSHDELGDPATLGLEIGKKIGQVQVSATENGFRATGYSASGAKFTVARGPSGERFKCIAGPKPGACPKDRKWSW